VNRDGLTRRDMLSQRDGGPAGGNGPGGGPAGGGGPGGGRLGGGADSGHRGPPEGSDGEETGGDGPGVEEPTGTGTVVNPRRGFLGRLNARTRSILTAAAVAAVLVNAGAVWAYWHITGSETGREHAGAVVKMNLRGRSNLNKPLTPGSAGDLTVTVTNDNNFPIRITSVSPGAGNVVADDEHRENGCVHHGVVVRSPSVEVQWDVERNKVGAFTVPNGLAMAATSGPACAGAVFTVPVLVNGVAGIS